MADNKSPHAGPVYNVIGINYITITPTSPDSCGAKDGATDQKRSILANPKIQWLISTGFTLVDIVVTVFC